MDRVGQSIGIALGAFSVNALGLNVLVAFVAWLANMPEAIRV